MKECKYCGSQMEDSAKFCRNCGNAVQDEYGSGYGDSGNQTYQQSYGHNYQQPYGQAYQPYGQMQDQGYYPQAPYQERKTNGFAVASLVLGIIGIFTGYLGAAFFAASAFPAMSFFAAFGILFFIPNGLAIILGIAGISRTKDPAVSGKGLAIAGLVLGCVFLLIWIVFAIFATQMIGSIGVYGDFYDMFYDGLYY